MFSAASHTLLLVVILSKTSVGFSWYYCLLNLQQREWAKYCYVYPVKIILL